MDGMDLVGAGYKVNSEKIKVASITITLSEDVVDLKENRADVCLAEMKASSMDLVLEDRSLEVTDVVAIAITIETKQAPPLPQVLRHLRLLRAPLLKSNLNHICNMTGLLNVILT
ncbi:hypothetical protein QR680_013800 [Steinernema hermaphroditum]|uniref:Uncharacterized protein n=1 Tax=Steinernema hermaphroditum TaxID=289476 RepID=A0AA39I6Q7_9BILA|nr:hypothetical protein QR680_013800 [Steinernema hermaphroditum]